MKTAVVRTFFTGLLAVVPVLATVYLVVWLAVTAETFLGRLLKLAIPDQLYFHGMGMLAGLAVVFGVGLLLQAWVVRAVFDWAESLLLRMPLVKFVYGAVRDFFGFFSAQRDTAAGQVVAIQVGDADMRLVGFMMREDLSALPEQLNEGGRVAVYLPMSYQVGGYTALVPREAVTPVDMSREEAMRFVLTAGLATAPPGQGGPGRGRSN